MILNWFDKKINAENEGNEHCNKYNPIKPRVLLG